MNTNLDAAATPSTGFDVIVIGAGVNGSGVARDCALRGLRVALFERNDIAFGASGNSSGFIHGGPRYLTADPNVTYQSCLDSGYIQSIAPHLLFRVPCLLPVEKRLGSRQELDAVDAFFELYDRYQPLKRGKPHTRLSPGELREVEPSLRGEYQGAVTFDEWGIDGSRLCVANVRDAYEHGAHVHIPVSVTEILRDQAGAVVGVSYRDPSSGQLIHVNAPCVVNATGAWAPLTSALLPATPGKPLDKLRLRPGKGVHIYFDRRLTDHALMVKAMDGRRVFLTPWQNMSIIGTTDDDFFGDLDNVFATFDETRYLIEAIARVFPPVKTARAIGTWSGVRPTLFEWGKPESSLSREHEIADHEQHGAPGLYSMIGGKLASYRSFAEEMSDIVCRQLGNTQACNTHRAKLPGGDETVEVESFAADAGIDELTATRLVYRHGDRAREVAARMRRRPSERAIVCACEPVTEAEVRYVVENEWAASVDAVSRRTRLGLGSCGGMRCAVRCGAILAEQTRQAPEVGQALGNAFLERAMCHRLSILGPTQLRQEALLLAQQRGQTGAPERFTGVHPELSRSVPVTWT